MQSLHSTLTLENMEIFITRKNINSLRLKVQAPSGEIKISAPWGIKEEVIKQFVLQNLSWIQEKQTRLNQFLPSPLAFTQGEVHYFLGQPYEFILHTSVSAKQIILHDNQLLMYLKNEGSQEEKANYLDTWYRAQLRKILQRLIPQWEETMGVKVNDWGIKKMKTRWGTCNPRAKRIWLNLELIKKPLECIEYVLVHELVHLWEPSHNHRFKAFMDQYYPNWRLIRTQLR